MNKKLLSLILLAGVIPGASVTTFGIVRSSQLNPTKLALKMIDRIEEEYGLSINFKGCQMYENNSFMDLDIWCVVEVNGFDYSSYELAETPTPYILDRYIKDQGECFFKRYEYTDIHSHRTFLDAYYYPNTSTLGLQEWDR